MRVLLGSNVALDVLLNRQPWPRMPLPFGKPMMTGT